MTTPNDSTSQKVSIELDAATAHKLATLSHASLAASGAMVAKSDDASVQESTPSPSKTVKIEMDTETAKEISQKLHEGLKASGAMVA